MAGVLPAVDNTEAMRAFRVSSRPEAPSGRRGRRSSLSPGGIAFSSRGFASDPRFREDCSALRWPRRNCGHHGRWDGPREAGHTIATTVEGDFATRKVGEDFVLTVLLWPDANLGLILLHIGRVTEQIAVVLSSW